MQPVRQRLRLRVLLALCPLWTVFAADMPIWVDICAMIFSTYALLRLAVVCTRGAVLPAPVEWSESLLGRASGALRRRREQPRVLLPGFGVIFAVGALFGLLVVGDAPGDAVLRASGITMIAPAIFVAVSYAAFFVGWRTYQLAPETVSGLIYPAAFALPDGDRRQVVLDRLMMVERRLPISDPVL